MQPTIIVSSYDEEPSVKAESNEHTAELRAAAKVEPRPQSVNAARITSTTIASSFSFTHRLSTIGSVQGRRMTAAEEQHGLQDLNDRFAFHLESIKHLADNNVGLRAQIDGVYQRYMEDDPSPHSPPSKWMTVRRQLNAELRQLATLQIRLQRADHDRKYYADKLRLFSSAEQAQLLQQKLNADVYELQFVKEQYEKQRISLQSTIRQYEEYLAKLNAYAHECYSAAYERIKIEQELYSLNAQVLFEQEYNRRCREEFESLEKIEQEFNNHFTDVELKETLQKIREDYRTHNQSQLAELELVYQTNLEVFRQDIHVNEKVIDSNEQPELSKQNRALGQQFKQLETELHQIVEQNRRELELLDEEYRRLDMQLPELESLILYSRDNTVHLSAEIETYRCLLLNLVPSPKQKAITGISFYHVDGMLWVRI